MKYQKDNHCSVFLPAGSHSAADISAAETGVFSGGKPVFSGFFRSYRWKRSRIKSFMDEVDVYAADHFPLRTS